MAGWHADLRHRLTEPGPAWWIAMAAGDRFRAEMRALVAEVERDELFPDGVVWLDAAEAHPWLRAAWPPALARVVAHADEWQPAVEGWCRRARALLVVEGGDVPPVGLAPGEAEHLKVLWLPDAASVAALGWTSFSVPTDPLAPAFTAAHAPWPLAIFSGSFKARAARAVAEGVDLAKLAAEGWLERSQGSAWRLHRSARAFLRAHAPEGVRAAALEAWFTASWIDERVNHLLVRPDVTFEDAVTLCFGWLEFGSFARYTRIVNAFNSWTRARGEQARVRFWHRAFVDLAQAAGDVVSVAVLSAAVSRCESDLGRIPSAKVWIDRSLANLSETEPRRLSALLQAASVSFAARDLPAAIDAAQRAVAVGEALGLASVHCAPAFADLAFYRLLAGDPEGAEAPLRAAIHILRTDGVGQTLVNVLNTLTMLMIALHRPDEAVAASAEAIQRAEHERHADALPFVLHSAAVAMLAADRAGEAHHLALRAMHASRPDAHAALTPLLALTYERVQVRLGGAAEVRRAVTTALAADGAPGFVPYAALLVAEALAACGERATAASLLDHLLSGDAEGHVRALAHVARAPLGGAAPRAAPDLPTHTTALLALLDTRQSL